MSKKKLTILFKAEVMRAAENDPKLSRIRLAQQFDVRINAKGILKNTNLVKTVGILHKR